ncbi:MAG: hypothetical protein ACP5VE_00255 [Chthonomonadales bacterium]
MKQVTHHSILHEGAQEVGAKLRADISRWTRVRRMVSIKPTVSCLACDGNGKVVCAVCGGTGKSKVILNEVQEDCPHCNGTGQITCVECAGVGQVPNVYRKPILWTLGLGALGWLIVLWVLLGRDVMPEERAHLAGGGGGGVITGRAPSSSGLPVVPRFTAPVQGATPRSPAPVLPGAIARPGSRPAGSTVFPGGGGGGMVSPGGTGAPPVQPPIQPR